MPPARVEPAFQPRERHQHATNWKGEVISLEKLVKAIAAGKANIGLVMANETAINATGPRDTRHARGAGDPLLQRRRSCARAGDK